MTPGLSRRRAPWRVGRKLGRTVYEQKFVDEADDMDRFLGIMDDARDAELVVALHNAHPHVLPTIPPSWEGPLRSEAVWSGFVWAVHAHRERNVITPVIDKGDLMTPEKAGDFGRALCAAERWLAQARRDPR